MKFRFSFLFLMLMFCTISAPTFAQDSLNVRRVGGASTSGNAWGVKVVGNLAYITAREAGLRIFDISNPMNPLQVGFYDTPGIAHNVVIAGDYAYVADWNGGLRVINVSNPTNPQEIYSSTLPSYADAIAIAGNYIYVTCYYTGMRIFDISNPASPVALGFYSTPGFAYGVTVLGSYAYVAGHSLGLRIVNISNPVSPVEVGFYNTPGWADDVDIFGNLAYIADDSTGLQIVDISNPAVPTLVGACDTPAQAYSIAVSNNFAFIADMSSGLRVINISNPSNPQEAGYYSTAGSVRDVAVSNGLLFVADYSNPNGFGIYQFFPITITRPNGSESLRIGTQDTIRWSSVGITENVSIELNRSYPSGTWETLFADTPNDGSELWTVTGPTTQTARIRILSISNPAICDTSNNSFRIYNPSEISRYSLSFNGISSNITVINSGVPVGNNPRTVATWVKIASVATGASPNFFSWGGTTTLTRFCLRAVWGGFLAFSGANADFSSSFVVADNNWHHVAVSYENSQVRIYADGNLVNTTSLTLNTGSDSLIVGAWYYNGTYQEVLNGNLNSIQVWNYVRTQTQIQQSMYANLSGTEPGLVGYWRFNEGSGTTAYNEVPGGANGTIYGAMWSTDVPQVVRVTRPNGNEIFRAGTVDTLRWIGFNTGAMRIDLNRTYPSGSWVTLFDSVANTGFVPWLVSGETSTATRIRITTLTEPILSDTSNANFTIQYPEPAAPGNLAITTLGENANLTWAMVDTNIYGQAITVDRYLVFFRAQESYGWNFLASTMGANSTQYTHATVVTHSPAMYYEVRAWIGDGDAFDKIVRELTIGTPEEVVLQRLGGQISQPIMKKIE